MVNDALVRHVCDQCSNEELDELLKGNYRPTPQATGSSMVAGKSAGEIFMMYMSDLRKTKSPSGYATDHVAAAKFRWKLDLAQEQKLRKLTHKDLRYVLDNFDGTG